MANPGPGPLDDLVGLKIVVHEQGATIAIELHGEWDLAGLPSVRQTFSRVLGGAHDCVVLDLSRLAFIDSSGLHATVELSVRLADTNRRLVIIPGPAPVQRLFEITGLLAGLPFLDERTQSADGRLRPALAGAPSGSSSMRGSEWRHEPSRERGRSPDAGGRS
jgi:anti-sigma B factor antagonist